MAISLTRALRLCALTCAALGALTAHAQSSEIFQCTDDNGKIEYKNTGSTKGCKKLAVDPVVVPKLATPAKAALQSSPQGFPKVDNTTQRARDNDRRHILEDELKTQETRLVDLRREYNNGEPERQGNERNYQRYLDRVDRIKADIARAESDITSIKSEIGKIQ